jgi:UDPglucose 6-dehydrogenase
MKIAVIGSGYVGLVSGACFADVGHEVICVDNDFKKIDGLNKGNVPIFEPGLNQIISRNFSKGRLKFTTDLSNALSSVDFVIIAVGTPTNHQAQKVDLSFVEEAVSQIKNSLTHDIIVIVKSTVPIGTCGKLNELLNKNSNYNCRVVSNPEFLREGHAIDDFMNPDRIVIGCDSDVESMLLQLYNDYVKRQKKILFTNFETAELIKYTSNTALAAKVALINEIANISEKLGADINQVVYGVGLDSRIGNRFLSPGPGFGGSCFPKDIAALVQIAEEADCNNNLISAITRSNDAHKLLISNNIIRFCNEFAASKIVSILGLTYKANTDDVRSSPSIDIINFLLDHGAIVQAYDPEGIDGAEKIWKDKVIFCSDLYKALENSNLAVILTEWDQFKNIDYYRLKKLMAVPAIYDLRNMIDKNKLDSEIKLYKLGCNSYL